MNKELYERLELDVTPFDAEDIITTSGIVRPDYHSGDNEQAVGLPIEMGF